jgi:DeoR/GlpR family transcriptional regulator of sugar metabolism
MLKTKSKYKYGERKDLILKTVREKPHLSLMDIAVECDCSKENVYYVLQRHKVIRRPRRAVYIEAKKYNWLFSRAEELGLSVNEYLNAILNDAMNEEQ